MKLRRDWPAPFPPVRRRELVAWALYDFANSGYTTVVITAVFNAYFVAVIAGNAAWATLAWTATLSASYALVVLGGPLLGAWADLRARKRELLVATTTVCVLGTAALAWCGPGALLPAIALVILTNVAFSTGENLIASFLPELARPEAMGRLSGYGWAVGYLGGLLVLALCLAWIQSAPARGSDTDTAVRGSMLITAAVFALAALPTLLLLRERAEPRAATESALALAWRRVRGAVSGSDGLLDLRRLLLCIVCYQAGVGTVITIAAIYTQQALGFSTEDSIRLILVVNLTAAVGAFGFGRIQDRLGHRRTLAITLLSWLLALAILWAGGESRSWVWVAANLAGISLGASQSAGRALVGYLCPRQREAEVFGLWGLAVKLAMIIGPLGYGVLSWSTGGDHRLAMLATSLYFIAGLAVLAGVNVPRGRRAALVAAAPVPIEGA